MLTVTPAALARLTRKLARRNCTEGEALRFMRGTGGWRLRPDRVRPTDMEFTHDGRSVLLLDAKVSKAMKDYTLDIRRTDDGPRLRLRRNDGSND